MLIINRKTRKEYTISQADWTFMVNNHSSRLFKVIDPTTQATGKMLIPSKITEFQANIKIPQPIKPKK